MSTDWGPGQGDEPTMNLPQRPPAPPPTPGGGSFPQPGPAWQSPQAPPHWQGPPGGPPYPYPVGGPGMPPIGYPPPRRRRRWPWWVAGAITAVITVVVITLVVVGGNDSTTTSNSAAPSSTRAPASSSSRPAPPTPSPSASPAAPALDIAALPSLLASADQVGNVLHDVQMRPREVATSLASDVSIDPAKCASAVAPALASTYTGSGYTGVAVQGLMEASPGRHKVIQAVAAFSDEAAAQQFYTQQLSAWRGCRLTGVTVSFTNGQPDDHATITIISETDGIASTVLLPAGASEHQGSECERAMGVRRNVVVDVRACGQNTITTGASLARVINDNITRHS